MNPSPDPVDSVRREFSTGGLAHPRLVRAFAAAAGLVVVAFTWSSERALAWFEHPSAAAWWAPLP